MGLPHPCTQSSPWPDVACDQSKPSPERLTLRIQRLSDVIWDGIETTGPRSHASSSPGKGLFAGSWDWHSCVHAHWALLTIARTRGDAGLEARLRKRFSATALQEERKFLNADKGFELPYGRAWLLLTLSELARRASAGKAVAAFRQEMQDTMLDWLETTSYPEPHTAPAFNAAHDSWLFAYLLTVLSVPHSTVALDRLRALRKKKIEPQRAAMAKTKHTPADFLFLPAVQATIDRVDPTATGTPAAYAVGVSPPLADPPLTHANAHSAGAALVRIWPHAIDARTGDPAPCARYHTRMNELFSRMDQWADSFEHVAHWVPQFMWMALWLNAGRP